MFSLVTGLLLSAMSAQASHFRGATFTWKKLASPAHSIELTVTEAWRIGSQDTLQYNWGDGSAGFTTSGGAIIATDPAFIVVRKVLTHTYSTDGPFTIAGSSSARISNLVNSANSAEQVAGVVDLRSVNAGSPIISSPIILQMIKGGLNTVPLSFSDVDGDPVTFRMATSAESSITTLASAGGKAIAVSAAGVLTWDTSATAVGQLYAVQVRANDNHPLSPSGAGASSIPFDFIVQIVDGTLNHPPVATGDAGPFTATIGQPFTNIITGTDPDGGSLTVTNQGLPTGATMSPASGTTAGQPLTATFSWTPTLADAGASVAVTIVFTDPTGLQAFKSFSISVPANQPPVANAGPDQTIYDLDSNDAPIVVTLDGSASFDPEHAGLTYSWTQTSGTTVQLTDAHTATPSFTAPDLHIHPNGQPAPVQLTFRLDVNDGNSTRSANVMIIVKHNNLPPVAVAAAPETALEGTAVILDGSGSSDPDQDPLTYTWTQTAGTPVNLENNGTNSPLVTFSHVINAPHSVPGEMLKFTLTVSDGIDANTSGEVAIFVQNVNTAPTADAGDDESVFDNVGLVSLAGSGTDFDGDSISLKWTQVAGPSVFLSNATSSTPSFTAPAVTPADGSAMLTFKLTVSDAIDANDAAALTDEKTVNVLVKHANRAPIADAGTNKAVPERTTAALDGSGSYDPDRDAMTYAWTQTSGTPVTLDTTDPVHPTFSVPDVGPDGATLSFQLVVSDIPTPGSGSSLSSAPSPMVITVKYVNRPPVAVVAVVAAHDEGSSVALDCSQSSDPDGNALTYAWTQVSGPAVSLSNPTAAQPVFTAPMVDRFGATLVFALKVTDEFGADSEIATTSVEVTNVNHAPVVDAGQPQSVPEGTAVSLTGIGTDPDTEEQSLLTYSWHQTAGPTVTLSGEHTENLNFTAPLLTAGGDPLAKITLTFRLVVIDPNGASASAETTVVVANVEHAPIANSGGVMFVNEAALVSLDGSLSSDPDNDALTYRWVQTSGPIVTLSGANTAYPYFTAPFVNAAGTTLKFKLTVDDGFGGSSSDCATVSVANINDPPTATNAQASLGTLWPPDHSMVKVSINGIVDPNNNSVIKITGVTQDEATNGLGDGDTAIDAIINGDGTVLLRAERSGKGNGRVYHVHFTASDFEGSVSGVVKVSVPHDKKSDVAIDGGELFDSTH